MNIQSYSKGQVVFKISMQNFKKNQIIHASKKSLEKPILLHKYLLKLHKKAIESTGTQIKSYVYSDE